MVPRRVSLSWLIRVPGVLAVAVAVSILGLTGCDSTLREQIELYVGIKNGGVIYVDGVSGDDANPGTREQPKKTIQNAIDLADALMDEGEVRVAEGTYHVYETLVVREGISLYGGFQASGWTRDVDLYPTELQGSGIETVIKPEQGVSSVTVIDGFTIEASSVVTAVCIWCERGSPTIRNNILDASQGSTDSIGILNSSSSPVILANTINAGGGSADAWGIANNNSPAQIWSNVIYGTGSNNNYKGIYNNNSDAIIQNNTIRCGLSAWDDVDHDVGIYNKDSNCIIENNIFFSSGSSCAIEEDNTNALPVRVNSNDFCDGVTLQCDPLYKYSVGRCDSLVQLGDYLSTTNGVSVADNVDSDPDFVDAGGMDWHLDSGSSLKEAGLPLSASFSIDRDGEERTDPWSIGAYEKDPP